jgi:hypothetical protein
MEANKLELLNEWFADYCRSFYTDNESDNRNYSLKEIHTRRVCGNMEFLTESLDLPPDDRAIAEIVALFHDVGRFEQYRQYATFRDDISENHATLGLKVLKAANVLSDLPGKVRRTICQAISLHNAFHIPAAIQGRELLFTRLIRDADKLDIWRVFDEFYGEPEEKRASAAGLGFPDLPGCSKEVIECIKRGEMVNLTMLKNLNDFKLLQLSWVFDLTFRASFSLLLERDYIGGIAKSLPKEDEVDGVIGIIRGFAVQRAAGGGTDE